MSDRNPEALLYLSELGLVPGVSITVKSHGPFGGPVWVGIGDRRVAIGRELASTIFVSEPGP